LSLSPYYPHSHSSADLEAARHADGELNRWFLDPLFGRSYPADILNDYFQSGILNTREPKFILPGDMDRVAVPLDFLAINYYFRIIVKSTNSQEFDHQRVTFLPTPKEHQTDMGWEIYPFGLYETLSRVYWEYKPRQMLVTENGASYSDGPADDDKVHDDRRIAYLKGHIQAVAAAIQSGIPVNGYYVWSLLDNFEWSYGYSQRFGLIYVDYETQRRIPKDSAFWYANVIRQNGLELESSPTGDD